jgi:phosphoglycolate phosphatase
VLFDLDGTLLNTLPDIAAAVDRTLRELGLPAAGLERTRDWVGNGAPKLLERALRHAGAEGAALQELSLQIFFSHYSGKLIGRSRPYPGAMKALRVLSARGLQLAVCTNKPSAFVRPLLEHFGMARYFSLSIGADDLPQKKPHPAPLLHIADAFGLTPGQCLMVGDSVNDVEAARAARMPVAAVSYGYNHGGPIADAQPDVVIDSLAELPELIAS